MLLAFNMLLESACLVFVARIFLISVFMSIILQFEGK
jgi:hypothetical protein